MKQQVPLVFCHGQIAAGSGSTCGGKGLPALPQFMHEPAAPPPRERVTAASKPCGLATFTSLFAANKLQRLHSPP